MIHEEIVRFVKEKYSSKNFVSLHEPVFRGNEEKYLKECIDSTYVSSVGLFVDKFELLINNIVKTKKTTAVINGTSALHIGLKLSGVKNGDEVLTQALTFVATANAIVYNNAYPVFLDVDYNTMGLSPKAVSEFLEEYGELREDGCYNKKTGRRISACLPMHTFGFPVKLDELIYICQKWEITLIEDAAESLGSTYKGKSTGSFGKIGVFSFNGNKIVTAGSGGALTTDSVEIGERAKYLTATAKISHKYEFFHSEIGYNYRMSNLNAAVGCAQLEQLPTFLQKKRDLALEYKDFFQKKGIKFREEPENTNANYWLMCIELDNKAEYNRILEHTNSSNVMTRPVWELMFNLPMYLNCQKDSQKNAMLLRERIINIPSGVL